MKQTSCKNERGHSAASSTTAASRHRCCAWLDANTPKIGEPFWKRMGRSLEENRKPRIRLLRDFYLLSCMLNIPGLSRALCRFGLTDTKQNKPRTSQMVNRLMSFFVGLWRTVVNTCLQPIYSDPSLGVSFLG